MHFHCECLVNGIQVEEPHSPEFQQARAIYTQLLGMGLQPWRTELSMYSAVLRCAGQADLIMRSPEDGSLVCHSLQCPILAHFGNNHGADQLDAVKPKNLRRIREPPARRRVPAHGSTAVMVPLFLFILPQKHVDGQTQQRLVSSE